MIVVASGTFTTGGTSEETVSTLVAPGRYGLLLDLNAVVGGATPDIYEARIKAAVLAGGTQRVHYPPGVMSFTGGLLAEPIQMREFLLSTTGALFTLKRAQGSTDRAIPWALLRDRPVGKVVDDAGNSATAFKTNLTDANDVWLDAIVRFLTGNCAGQIKRVTDFVAATDVITVASPGFTEEPAADDVFELVNV